MPTGSAFENIHEWRPRRSRVGELVQRDTSEHAGLEERGPKLYLISMIDDASSRIHARFVRSGSTEENMRLLWKYVERNGRPVSYYTDKASLFQTAPKTARDSKELPRDERDPLPPTQSEGRAAKAGSRGEEQGKAFRVQEYLDEGFSEKERTLDQPSDRRIQCDQLTLQGGSLGEEGRGSNGSPDTGKRLRGPDAT